MQCPTCGTAVLPGKGFCHACGARVAVSCPSCGVAVTVGFRFCPDCGVPIAAAPDIDGPHAAVAAPQPSPSDPPEKSRLATEAVAGERKQVTVLFCDLAGSTAIAARLDPEEYRELLDQYVALAIDEVYRFEGIVNQLAGDGLMALFGAPVAHEDAPQRAVRAALGIQAALGRLNEGLQRDGAYELRARIGIHTGPVVVGTVGNDLKMDYTAIGDTTNLASRLESLAAPGSILISEATARLLRDMFTLDRTGPLAVKGKADPVVAYTVIGVAQPATPLAPPASRPLTPFVGRRGEMAHLLACAAQLEHDLPQVVTVIGDAGSGKSRLLYEFKAHLADLPVALFEARCSAWSQMVPYAPWIAMLKQHFTIAADDLAETAAATLAATLRPLDPTLDTIYPYIARLLSLPVAGDEGSADDLKRRTFEAVRAVIFGDGTRRPVVIIEDVHWIDQPSHEMLDVAVSEMERRGIMLLVSHRPDYAVTWRPHASYTQLHLQRLTTAHITEIMRAIAGGPLPEAIERLVLGKAEGNPFLAEEVTRSLLEEGALSREGGVHVLTRPVGDIRIPGTVQEIVAARLDRLGPGAKRVLQVAAVLGRQFSREHLAQLLAPEGIDVTRALEDLERRGVIHRKHLFADDEYRFGESVTQEVAYDGLLLKQRRQLHERIGLLLEAAPGEAGVERLALVAHHFAHSDSRDRAVSAFLDAARAAEQVPAFPTAARFYRDAWHAAISATDAPALSARAADAAVGLARMTVIYNVPDPGDVEGIMSDARRLAEDAADIPVFATLRTYHGLLLMGSSRTRFAEGMELVEHGLAVAQESGHAQTALGISRALAWGYFMDGRFALARQTLAATLDAFERTGDARRLTDVYMGTRWMLERLRLSSDDIAGAEQALHETYELALRANNRIMQSSCAAALAQIHFLRAEYAEARLWADRAIAVARPIGHTVNCAAAGATALAALTELGDSAPGRYVELVDQSLAPGSDLTVNVHVVVHMLLLAGQPRLAERAATQAYARAGGRLRELHAALAMAAVHTHGPPAHWSDAERWYAEAIGLSDTLGVGSAQAMAHFGAGTLAARRGGASASQAHWEDALRLSRTLDLRHLEAHIARRLSEQPAPVAAGAR